MLRHPGPLLNAQQKSTHVPALAALYFAYYAGAFMWTYLPRHLEAIGWSGATIGAIYALRSLVKSVLQPIWAAGADRTGSTVRLVRIQLLFGALALAALPFSRSVIIVGAAIVGQAATAGAAIPLVDALTLRQVGAEGYGRLRAWGSVGFGVLAATAAGYGIWSTHEQLANLSPWVLVGSLGVGFLVSLGLSGQSLDVDAPSLGETARLLGRPALLALLPLAALHWAAVTPYNMFIVFLCEQRGFGAWVPGAAVVLGITFEVAAFAASSWLLSRWSPRRLLITAVLVSSARWWATGVVDNQWAVLFLQSLHGMTFGCFYVARMAFLDRDVESNVRATGQALFFFVVFGLGSALGSWLSGYLIDTVTAATLFEWTGYFEVGVLIVSLLGAPFLAPDRPDAE